MALRWSGYNLPPAQGIFHGKKIKETDAIFDNIKKKTKK